MPASSASPGTADLDTARGQEGTPLAIDGKLYVVTVLVRGEGL